MLLIVPGFFDQSETDLFAVIQGGSSYCPQSLVIGASSTGRTLFAARRTVDLSLPKTLSVKWRSGGTSNRYLELVCLEIVTDHAVARGDGRNQVTPILYLINRDSTMKD